MFGTLIGIFITSTAIVIGADSAISENNGNVFNLLKPGKTCRTGSGSVATLQGEYLIELIPETHDAWLVNSFRKTCISLESMNASLEEQANLISGELLAQVQSRMSTIDKAYLNRRFGKQSHVNYMSVSGYENGEPRVIVQELRLDQSADGNWKPSVVAAPDLSPKRCEPRFHGEDWTAKRLLKDLPDGCPASTVDQAIKLFEDAVRLTMKDGRRPGMRGGFVGGELDLWVIPLDGIAKHKRLPEP